MKKILLLLFFVTSSCSVILGTYISMVASQVYKGDVNGSSYTATFDSDGNFILTKASSNVGTYTLQHTSSNGVGTYKVGTCYAKVEIATEDEEHLLNIYKTGVSKNAALNQTEITHTLYRVEKSDD